MLQKLLNFVKKWGEDMGWGVWCKGVQCLVMGELKQNKISSLKSLIVAFLPLEDKDVL
jgi:hypothetical protein